MIAILTAGRSFSAFGFHFIFSAFFLMTATICFAQATRVVYAGCSPSSSLRYMCFIGVCARTFLCKLWFMEVYADLVCGLRPSRLFQ